MKTKILYEDRDIIVCHKPVGIAVQSAGIGSMDMVSELKRYLNQPYLGIVHRLDQPVEGIIVFAKTSKAAAELSKQTAVSIPILREGQTAASISILREGQTVTLIQTVCAEQVQKASEKIMKKIYHAKVYGHLPEMSGELQDYLVKDAKTNTSRVVNMPKGAPAEPMQDGRKHQDRGNTSKESPKWSYLTYKVLERQDETDLLEIRLFTGRHHQIRVQFSHAGYPLAGDAKYASEKSAEYNQKNNIKAVLLKAVQLEFTHPVSGRRMTFSIQGM